MLPSLPYLLICIYNTFAKETFMDYKDIKKHIKRRIKKGTFKNIATNSRNISATFNALKDSWCYYLERKDYGLLAYNTLTNQLTIYRIK